MASELPAEVARDIASLEAAVGEIDGHIKPLLAQPVHTLRSQLSPLEAAKFDLNVAYAINSLFWVYLCTQGGATKDHPVRTELTRVRDYMKKIQDAETATERDPAMSRVNKEAAQRFIRGALFDASKMDTSEDQVEEGAAASSAKRKSKGSAEQAESTEPSRTKKKKKKPKA
eukprot:m.487206 g.487206  ORF g.487206 m.487206 type:complete len:172 (-) comp24871_c0_seq1:87-602(-)